jgi:replicative DNA helicase
MADPKEGRSRSSSLRVRSFDEVLEERVEELSRMRARKAAGEDVRLFVPTGLAPLDRNGGLERGVLTVIGAATGEGKSITKLELMRGAASAGLRVLALDFEDPAKKTADRALAGPTGLNSRKLGLLDFDEQAEEQLRAALKQERSWARRVSHAAGLLTRTEVMAALEEYPECELVMLDYAQALPQGEDPTLERAIAQLGWDLNQAAQQLHPKRGGRDMAVLVYSQVVAEVENRGARVYERSVQRDPENADLTGYRPGPGAGDLAWSKALGQRAKCVIYLHRPGRWARKHGVNAKDDRMEFIVAKSNFSNEGTVTLGFDGPTARLFELPKGK